MLCQGASKRAAPQAAGLKLGRRGSGRRTPWPLRVGAGVCRVGPPYLFLARPRSVVPVERNSVIGLAQVDGGRFLKLGWPN
jgi:hypothetical protein